MSDFADTWGWVDDPNEQPEYHPAAHRFADNDQRRDPGIPAVPATFTPDDDVNPICGHHKRNQCLGCGACTTCDGCYCYED